MIIKFKMPKHRCNTYARSVGEIITLIMKYNIIEQADIFLICKNQKVNANSIINWFSLCSDVVEEFALESDLSTLSQVKDEIDHFFRIDNTVI